MFKFEVLYTCKKHKLVLGGSSHVNVKVNEKSMVDETTLDDIALLDLIDQGYSYALEVLIKRYKRFVYAKAQTYFIIGGDREDIIQEGMIGLYKAVRDFNKDKLASFKGFAELCITRQIITAVKMATRQKHIPLNSYISLYKPMYDDESERTLLDIIVESGSVDPQELMITQEKRANIEEKLLELLSDLELRVLYLYLDGCSYQEISKKINRHQKSIDNALQRIKRKCGQLLVTKEVQL